MKLRIPALSQDMSQAGLKEGALTQPIELEDAYFLDGPISRRVAILDFDPETGALLPGAKLLPADGAIRRYDIDLDDPTAIDTPEFRAVMVFGTINKTIQMFEDPHILGREIRWAFDGPQLLVVPRAGEWRNAFYERDSRSLQFFFFDHQGKRIYTSLSEDIVAHETGHAILDGVVPDLYDAITPQALAIHEAVADLIALVRAMENAKLRDKILKSPSWSIEQSNDFTALAEEFGTALSQGRTHYLRNAFNSKSLDPAAGDDAVSGTEPHDLAQVLTGALYAVLVNRYRAFKQQNDAAGMDEIPARGKALGTAAQRFERFVFRALDYLPPGDITFADFVRAVIAADKAAYPDATHDTDRRVLREEALTRRIAEDKAELEVDVLFDHPAVSDPELSYDSLVASDWHAYEFVNANRDLFGIPAGEPFALRPRLEVQRLFFRTAGEEPVNELIVKASWEQEEDNGLGSSFPSRRDVTMGTTLVIDRDARIVRARLTTDQAARRVPERDAFLRKLVEEDLLVPASVAAAGGRTPQAAIAAQVLGNRMKVTGTCRSLHVTADALEG